MLSDAQFSRLSRGATLPRKQDDRRQNARVPFAAQVKVYPIIGKGQFGAPMSVRCRDLSASGVSFLWQKPLEKGMNLLMRFVGATVDHPFNIIGSVVRIERVTPTLFVIATRFDAVPVEETAAATGPAIVAADAAVAAVEAPKVTPPISFEAPVAEVTFEEPKQAETPPEDDELARIRAAVLF